MAAARLRRWRWRFAAHGLQHALIGFGAEIVCAHLNAVEWSTMLPATRAKIGPSLPRRAGLFRTAASRMTRVRRKRRSGPAHRPRSGLDISIKLPGELF